MESFERSRVQQIYLVHVYWNYTDNIGSFLPILSFCTPLHSWLDIDDDVRPFKVGHWFTKFDKKLNHNPS